MIVPISNWLSNVELTSVEIKIKLPTLHPTQKLAYQSPARYKVLACGRRWGKDKLLLKVAIEAFLNGKEIAVLTPKDIDSDKMREQHRMVLKPLEDRKLVKWTANPPKVEFLPKSGLIRYYTAKNYSSIRGSGLDLLVANECGELSMMFDLEKAWEKVMRPALVDRIGKAWFAGTPRGVNSFYRLFMRGESDAGLSKQERGSWQHWQYSSFENPHISEEEIKKMIEEEHLSPQAVAQEIYAQFVEDEGGVFTDISKVCCLSRRSPDGLKPRTTVMGIDIGLSLDYTAVSIIGFAKSPLMEYDLLRWRTSNIKKTLEAIIALADKWQVAAAAVETNAIGQYFFEEMANRLAPRVNVVGYYMNHTTKSDVIFNFRDALVKGELLLLNDQEAAAELSSYSAKQRDSGTFRLSATGGVHDDTVIARALALQVAKNYASPVYVHQRSVVSTLDPVGSGVRRNARDGVSRITYSLPLPETPSIGAIRLR